MNASARSRLFLALSFLGCAHAADVNIGESREEVVAKLAKPTAVANRGGREIFLFANGGRVEFTDGKVSDVKGPLPDAPAGLPALPPAAPAPAKSSASSTGQTGRPRPTAPASRVTTAESAPPTASVTTSAPAEPRPPSAAAPAEKDKSAALAAAVAAGRAKANDAAAMERAKARDEALGKAGVKTTKGPATVKVGKVAELKLAAGYAYVGQDSIERFYELTHNMRNGKEAGVLLSPGDWLLFFDYDDIGYVKDDEKNELDAEKLMKAMVENQEDVNAARKKRGWDEMRLKGWAAAPHYDPKTNNLKWAINLTTSTDGFKEVSVNESIRLLGRGGVMNVTLVTEAATFKKAEGEADRVLADGFSYVSGEKYAEFKPGDKIAAIGLGALVLGGAGVMAAKSGLLGKLWKLLVLAVLAAAAAVKKFWDRIIGAKEPPPSA